jgi:hypothetical protein
MSKAHCAVAAHTVLISSSLIHVKADDASSAPESTCEFGEPRNTYALTPEQIAASAAKFAEYCGKGGRHFGQWR